MSTNAFTTTTLSIIHDTTKMYEDILRCTNCKKQSEKLVQICDSTDCKGVDKMDQRFVSGCICCCDCYATNDGFKGRINKDTMKHPCTLCEKTCVMLFNFYETAQMASFTTSQKRGIIKNRSKFNSLGNPKIVENMQSMKAAQEYANQRFAEADHNVSKMESENSTLKRKLEHTKHLKEKAHRLQAEGESALPNLEASILANNISEAINDLAQMESDRYAMEEDGQERDVVEEMLGRDEEMSLQAQQDGVDDLDVVVEEQQEQQEEDMPLARSGVGGKKRKESDLEQEEEQLSKRKRRNKVVTEQESSSSIVPTPSTTIESIEEQIQSMAPLTADRTPSSLTPVVQEEEQAVEISSPSVSESTTTGAISTKKKPGRKPLPKAPHYASLMRDNLNTSMQERLNRWMEDPNNTEAAFWAQINQKARDARARRNTQRMEEEEKLRGLAEELNGVRSYYENRLTETNNKLSRAINAISLLKPDIMKLANMALQGKLDKVNLITKDEFVEMFPSFKCALNED